MKIALIGAAGQLGTDLARLLPSCLPLTHADIEITDAASVQRVLDAAAPNVVINTAAYNLVDKAEDDPVTAMAINATGPEHLARWCAANNAVLMHVSTDYVFGADEFRTIPYTEDDIPGPLGVYGSSKLAGENAVKQLCPQYFLIRTCGLYGHAATKSKGNFVKTMFRLAGERSELKVVNDQHCAPSFTADVAAMMVALLRTQAYGVYHAVNSGATTWFDVATLALQLSGSKTKVLPIPTSEYPTRARRPVYSVLSSQKAEAVTGMMMPTWQDALGRYLNP